MSTAGIVEIPLPGGRCAWAHMPHDTEAAAWQAALTAPVTVVTLRPGEQARLFTEAAS